MKTSVSERVDELEMRLGIKSSQGDDVNLSQMLESLRVQQRVYAERMGGGGSFSYKVGARVRVWEPLSRSLHTQSMMYNQDKIRRAFSDKLMSNALVEVGQECVLEPLMSNVSVSDIGVAKLNLGEQVEGATSVVVTEARPRLVTHMMQLEQYFQRLSHELQETRRVVKLRMGANEKLQRSGN